MRIGAAPAAGSDRERQLQALLARAKELLRHAQEPAPASLGDLRGFDGALRAYFAGRVAIGPASDEELTILREVGALLDRAKALAAVRQTATAQALGRLHQRRHGAAQYRANELLG